MLSLLDDYSGVFEPDFHLGRLAHPALARFTREVMLFASFHDRAAMPLVGKNFGARAMTAVACDEWIGSSPIYNARNRRLQGIGGDGASAVLKAFQLDVGMPHEYMDAGYQLVNERLGFFWLKSCGALNDVLKISPESDQAVIQLCHHMEDPTFPATVTAVNRRAQISAVHRPPLEPDHEGPACRWRVEIGENEDQFEELPITDVVRATRAAQMEFETGGEEDGEGLADYSGPFKPDFVLEDFSRSALVRQCKEFALDAHLLMRAAFVSIGARHGADDALSVAREEWAGVAAVAIPRLRERLRIDGDDMASILKTLQIDPALPYDYVRRGAELLDERRGRFWLEDCPALEPGEPGAWLELLEKQDSACLQPPVTAVNPRARIRPIDPGSIGAAPARLAWEIEIDPDAEPLAESPLANVIRVSSVSRVVFQRG